MIHHLFHYFAYRQKTNDPTISHATGTDSFRLRTCRSAIISGVSAGGGYAKEETIPSLHLLA
jgi:hypothetical protein